MSQELSKFLMSVCTDPTSFNYDHYFDRYISATHLIGQKNACLLIRSYPSHGSPIK